MLNRLFPVFILMLVFSCQENKNAPLVEEDVELKTNEMIDNHSYSNVEEINTTHLSLKLEVNFDSHIITGVARHKMDNKGTEKAVFDIKEIEISKVTVGKEGEEQETTFEIGSFDSIFGTPLVVDIAEDSEWVNIYYETSPKADAIDWLTADKTHSGKYPFLYTQGEAILTRSWIPVQDVPSNRFTYSASVQVPSGMLALMSATNPQETNESGLYHFEMKQPISAYLLALAAGELVYEKLDERSGVYAEPSIAKSAAAEFKDIPKMIDAAERLYGEYQWGMYDVLFLPASFPFGGMENPRLTFATPTVLAGDGSLVSLVAHELAHSWSGNLVTNATWSDFWLNEGFTVYFENRIMEEIYGKETADMLYMIEFQELLATIKEMKEDGAEDDSKLKLDLEGRNPDDGMTDIAYIKGSLFLKTLEDKVGRAKFDEFVKGYFKHYEFQTITTEDFVSYLKEHLLEKENLDFDYDEWIYGQGIPSNAVKISSSKLIEVESFAQDIKEGKMLPADLQRQDKITQEWLAFIRAFNGHLSVDTMKMIDEQLHFKDSDNAEIMAEWFVLGVQNDYMEIRPNLEAFLIKVGRRKFLEPIYKALARHSDESYEWGQSVYQKAKPHYHAVTYYTIDDILEKR